VTVSYGIKKKKPNRIKIPDSVFTPDEDPTRYVRSGQLSRDVRERIWNALVEVGGGGTKYQNVRCSSSMLFHPNIISPTETECGVYISKELA
jgi:hypothetical protein